MEPYSKPENVAPAGIEAKPEEPTNVIYASIEVKTEEKPIEGDNSAPRAQVKIEMSNPAGIFQVDNLLATKIKGSGLDGYISVEVIVAGGEHFTMDDSTFRPA